MTKRKADGGEEKKTNVRDEGGEEVLRGEVVGWGEGGADWEGVGKVTEMLTDERGGGEIISHYKSRERDAP